jgi:hypothetical protein
MESGKKGVKKEEILHLSKTIVSEKRRMHTRTRAITL